MLLLAVLTTLTLNNSVSADLGSLLGGAATAGVFVYTTYAMYNNEQKLWHAIDLQEAGIPDLLNAIKAGIETEQKHKLFFYAVQKDNLSAAKLLYEENLTRIMTEEKDVYHPIHYAAHCGSFEVIEMLLNSKDINIDSRTENGKTAFLIAVMQGHYEIAQWLANHDANIYAETNNGWNALHCAAKSNNLQLFKWLYKKTNVDCWKTTTAGYIPFAIAIAHGSQNVVKWCVEKRGYIRGYINDMVWRWHINNIEMTALMAAAYHKQFEMVAMLVNYGATINQTDLKTIAAPEIPDEIILFLEALVKKDTETRDFFLRKYTTNVK